MSPHFAGMRAAVFAALLLSGASALQPYGLSADGVAERSAFGFAAWPRLSWSLGGQRGAAQESFRVTVCAVDPVSGSCGGAPDVLDSGVVAAATQHWDALAGNGSVPALISHTRFRWTVTVVDAASGAPASASASFTSGIVELEWLGAEWLAPLDGQHGRVRLAFAAPAGGFRVVGTDILQVFATQFSIVGILIDLCAGDAIGQPHRGCRAWRGGRQLGHRRSGGRFGGCCRLWRWRRGLCWRRRRCDRLRVGLNGRRLGGRRLGLGGGRHFRRGR